MQEGWSDRIEFCAADGKNWYAALTPTDVHGAAGTPLQDTSDCLWVITAPDGTVADKLEWLPYRHIHGDPWMAKVHCRYNVAPPGAGAGPYIACSIEHKRPDGADDHEDNQIHFRDWQGRWWRGQISNVSPPFPGAPRFLLSTPWG